MGLRTDRRALGGIDGIGGIGGIAGIGGIGGIGGAASAGGRLRGLDGLRGLAVAAVLVFHGGWSWGGGGFLGVSLFFTLSGFLICSLLLAEHQQSGRIDLPAFWARRFRRLLPAAWFTLAVVLVMSVVLGVADRRLRLDVAAALGQVLNWRLLTVHSSYADLFRTPSPVQHYWSLAIEEQFYLGFPLVVAGVMWLARGRRIVLGLTMAVAIAGVSIATVLTAPGSDRVYYGTDTRSIELLLGAVLACVMSAPRLRRGLVRAGGLRGAAVVMGLAAGLATLFAWHEARVSSPFVAGGGLALIGVLSCLLIVASALPVGPVARLCRLAPLRTLGRISYAVYLFHWPVFVWLTERRTGLSHVPRFVLCCGLVIVLALLSERLLERPVRAGGTLAGISPATLAPVVIVVLALAVIAAGVIPRADSAAAGNLDLDRAEQQLAARVAAAQAAVNSAVPTAPSVTTTGDPDAPSNGASPNDGSSETPGVSFFGDSVTLTLALSVSSWNDTHHLLRVGLGAAALGCGILRTGVRRVGEAESRRDECDWTTRWIARSAGDGHQVAVISSCKWEMVDRRFPPDVRWVSPGDPQLDARLVEDLGAATDLLATSFTQVVWLTCVQPSRLDLDAIEQGFRDAREPERTARLNEIIRQVVAARPAVQLIDLGAQLADRVDDVSIRPDGFHFAGDEPVASAFLSQQVRRIWEGR